MFEDIFKKSRNMYSVNSDGAAQFRNSYGGFMQTIFLIKEIFITAIFKWLLIIKIIHFDLE